MRLSKNSVLRFTALLSALILLIGVVVSEGHAVLKESSPSANGTVKGPDVPISLKFNVRVDAARSKVQLLKPDNTTVELSLVNDSQVPPDTLMAKAAGLKPGAYKIQWQVLAPDGHITRGEVPFTVQP
jgi:copper resistance protein C